MLRRIFWLGGVLLLGAVVAPIQAQPQDLEPTSLSLDDLSAFREPPANWSVADSVWADPDRRRHLRSVSGTGVLVNQPSDAADGHLLTSWTHQDLTLELDVLMPRGSNSGLYLQGRYEIQLLDSWGVETPTYGDMGGIYQRWDSRRPEGERGFEGHPPRVNVAKAPGLWQHLTIDFRAPRFNEEGEKVENARFEKVTLNGVVIHRNVELSGPTRAAAFDGEVRTGPLMIQGDHGPVAIKNVQYERYRPGTIALSDLRYKRYDVSLDEGFAQLDTVEVAAQGSTDRISPDVIDKEDDFAAEFTGTLTVPRTGTYAFEMLFHWIHGSASLDQEVGGGRLHIGDNLVVAHPGTSRTATGTVRLEEGDHSFRFLYFKNRPWVSSARATLWIEGPQLRRRTLTTEVVPVAPGDPIHLTPGPQPTLLRSFLRHGGEKKTHVISVGGSRGGAYAYDLAQGSLLRAWKGNFLKMNPMWEGRGQEQRAVPMGSGPVFSGAPPLAVLSERSAPWPDSVQRRVEHEYLGYRVGSKGYPTFQYRVGPLEVRDRLRTDSTAGRLVRTLRVSGEPPADPLYARLVRADGLRRAGPDRFVAGDRAFYVELERGGEGAFVRRRDGEGELLVPVPSGSLPTDLRYAIIW